MSLRIICLEEHMMDADLAKATQAAMAKQAPYFGDVGTAYNDDPANRPNERPSLVAAKIAFQLANAPLESRLPAMDEAGIDMQILSFSNATQAAPASEAADLAQAANDRLAEAIAKHPGRFGGFSTLPWQNPAAAVREAERSAKELGLHATMLTGRPGESAMIDDLMFEPILATLADLDVPLYIHPGAPLPQVQQSYYGGFNKEVTARFSLFGWGWHNEAGIQVLRLILSGALDRYSNLKIISGHWGEMVPFFLQRMDDAIPVGATGLRRSITQTYRDQVWVTPSGMLTLPHFQFIRATLGCDRILFSVDYPFLTLTGARAWLEGLQITEEERIAIANGNASKLLSGRQA